ncbi:MAG: STAS domain-containing protein [Candidatus Sumerlaeia bacterium]|nr:STAS domain-containing protein [Candidatus Sumerlaeia bacterium]
MKSYDLLIHPAEDGTPFRRVDVIGTLDSHTVQGFEQSLHSLLDDGIPRLLLNIEQLTYISSAGISALMGLTHRLRQTNGELVLLKPTEKVYRVFRTLGFTNIFKIVDSDTELTAAFNL